MYDAKIILDSLAPSGFRLTTMEITYPRFVHSEFLTHRMFSRNSASNRAIPIGKVIQRVQDDPVIPVYWGANQKGMQAEHELNQDEIIQAKAIWLLAMRSAVAAAVDMMERTNVHKQLVNRLLEPWQWITTIVTATEWENFFELRCHPAAQPELRKIAEMMRDLYRESEPKKVHDGYVHTPYIYEEDGPLGRVDRMAISTARCARVSYLTHDGKRDHREDLRLHSQLLNDKHMSPFEHVAVVAADPDLRSGNFRGWVQYRKMIGF